MSSGKVAIGTSGWSYPHWWGRFYPAEVKPAQALAYYARRFGSVELNSTFYRLPTEQAVESWRAATPSRFCFAVKGSRFLTHMKKLGDPASALQKFLPLAELLGPKLGPILFQLPPRWRCNPQRLESFLEALPTRHRYAFELRDHSWLTPSVYDVLARHRAAFCIYELAGFQSPLEVTTDFTYIRLHGPDGKYAGDYSSATLKMWARRIEAWRRSLRALFVYFDNDQQAFAAKNAGALQRMLGD